jgi:hypothetical protein
MSGRVLVRACEQRRRMVFPQRPIRVVALAKVKRGSQMDRELETIARMMAEDPQVHLAEAWAAVVGTHLGSGALFSMVGFDVLSRLGAIARDEACRLKH